MPETISTPGAEQDWEEISSFQHFTKDFFQLFRLGMNRQNNPVRIHQIGISSRGRNMDLLYYLLN